MSDQLVTIHTSLLFCPTSKSFLADRSLTVSCTTGLVTNCYARNTPLPATLAAAENVIDLRGLTVLPGLVDAHTHIFLHAYADTPALNQMRDESPVERIVRATTHVRSALLAGYTTYRDLGTEGLYDADLGVRNAINRGLIPGPRLFVATEAVASSGGYAIRQEGELGESGAPGALSIGTQAVRIADVADGVDGVRAAVRRRIGAGCDVVKFYADYRKRALRWPISSWKGCPEIQFPPEGERRSPNYTLWTQAEMDTMVAEARSASCPVAAHCGGDEAVIMASRAGVTTVEHGYLPSDEALEVMKEKGVVYVPTLAVFELFFKETMKQSLERVKKAWDVGVKIAAGGDTGAFAHGENVREVELMLEAGIPLEEVLVSATLRGWEACGGEWCGRRFGWWEKGCAADVVALEGNLMEDRAALRKVRFVMKDGKVWKRDGLPVGMF